MRRSCFLAITLLTCLLFCGCNSGTGNPFAGSQWDAGVHHISFTQTVAEWNTALNRLELKFGLLSGSSYPNAIVIVEEVTTLTVNQPRDVTVNLEISQDLVFQVDPTFPDTNATITFTQLDLNTLGAVSGTITGMAREVGAPGLDPVALTAGFDQVIITN